MAYKALYRTYRPTTFDEVAGQQHIVKTLKNALATNKISHAYLFCGPRGTGKTTMAKILAKALNCNEGMGHICNSCDNCKSINDGQHPDVLEVDAASNRGIKEIKELMETINNACLLGRYKVYIIDEVHMMTPEAFNALLKTLEEPPAHVVFILATTEPHKLLPTILSRCQRYDFSRVSDDDIRARVKVILEHENIEYNEEAINLIISLADGGMRDTLSMLDQVLAYSGNKLNTEDVLSIFSLESKAEKISLLYSICKNDISDILDRINKYVEKGTDIKRLTTDLLAILKDVLVFSFTNNKSHLQVINQVDADDILQNLSIENINAMIDILMNSIKDFKMVSDINTLFEITLLKLASSCVEIEQQQPKVFAEIKREEPKNNVKEKTEIKIEDTTKENSPIDSTQSIDEPSLIKEIDKTLYLSDVINQASISINQDLMIKIMVSSKKEIKNYFLEHWSDLKKLAANSTYGKIATLLLDAHPLVASSNMLVLEYQLPKQVEKINTKTAQKVIQTIINHIFNKRVFVYAVSRSDSVDLQQAYRNLLEIKKLPKATEINLEFSEE